MLRIILAGMSLIAEAGVVKRVTKLLRSRIRMKEYGLEKHLINIKNPDPKDPAFYCP
jgi:hypothetical protein